MKKYMTIVMMCIFVLTACNEAQHEQSNNNNKDLPYQLVSQSELNKYWMIESSSYSIESESLVNPKLPGSVEVGFTIDVYGQTANFEVLRASPEGLWQEHAILAAKQLSFRSNETEKAESALYTTWTFHFTP